MALCTVAAPTAGCSPGRTCGGEGTERGQMGKQLGGRWGIGEHETISQNRQQVHTGQVVDLGHVLPTSAAHTPARTELSTGEAPALARMVCSTWNALALDPSGLSSAGCMHMGGAGSVSGAKGIQPECVPVGMGRQIVTQTQNSILYVSPSLILQVH